MKRLFGLKTWMVVGAAIGIAIAAILFVAYEQHRATEKYKAHRQEYCSTVVATVEQKKACAEEGTDASDYLPWGYKLVSWPDGITTWAIIFTGFAIAWQSWETRKSAKATRDAIILQHRPKIVVRSLKLIRQKSGVFNIKLILRNSGSTVANIEEWEFNIMWTKSGHPTQTHTEKISAMPLNPGQTCARSFTAPEFYVQFESSLAILTENPAQEQAVAFVCAALIPYRDEIGTKRDTAICRIYRFREEVFTVWEDAKEEDYSD